ncbi:hypothetical protein L596_007404 [Steinernema carpocapsae]|uniref:FAD dependent oxidoreductase domain-containing protein n=1 Tax=Steinernema carpocapsae TaxID=34508 RepID=A0A4U5P968_STECR|nr:hypothetical protein L596_007404 [Steinernema carpocapsae]
MVLLRLRALRSPFSISLRRRFSNNGNGTPVKADVVVCGGGITGLSVAYNLAKHGKKVYLFEKECIATAGATALSAGLVTAPMFWQDATNQYMTHKSIEMYSEMAKSGRFTFNRCGRVYMAQTPASEISLKRIYSRAILHHEDAELVDCQSEMLSRWPMLATEDVCLALFSPGDISMDAVGLCHEIANRSADLGVEIHENCAVKRILLGDEQQVYAVETDDSLIETSKFVDASGIWSGRVPVNSLSNGRMRLATYPCTYSYLRTGKLPNNVHAQTPIFTDIDSGVYIKATDYNTLCGGFVEEEIRALSTTQDDIDLKWTIPESDWDKFYHVLERQVERCSSLAACEHGDLICGADNYTPDKFPIVGECDSAKGYYVATGLNGQGLTLAGGIGSVLADWIVGKLDVDVAKIDVTRFLDLHTNPQYLIERVPEIAGYTYKNMYHSHQCHTARNLRMSPIYYKLRDSGAVFGEIMGYERPLWFSNDVEKTRNALFNGQDSLIGKPVWFPYVAKEYEACRERVGLIDLSSFSKFDVSGSDVVPFLQRICSANIDKPIGSTIYTGMQNESGGYVTDCTVSRIANDQYFVVAPTIQQLRCALWMKKWAKEWRQNVHIQDSTGLYTALNVVGPASRALMQDVTGKELSSSEFPSFSYRELNIGMATGIRAISVTHCGELGWVLYIPNEVAQNVYEHLMEAGKEYSMLEAGYYTLRQLRIEKFYVYWGQDINSTVTPVECGRAFRVDFNKDFIGKEALIRQMEKGVNRRFIQLLIDKHDLENDPWPQGGELIYRDGKPVGWTTSAAYGFTLGCQVCIGFLENKQFGISPEFINTGIYEIDIANKRFPVRVNLHSPSLPMVSSEHPIHYRPTQ